MSVENKTVMRRIYDELWNEGAYDIVDELVSADYVGHLPTPPSAPSGRDGLLWLIKTYRAAFPDIHVTITDQVSEGDKVFTAINLQGTHQAQFMHLPATHKKVNVNAMVITRFEDGKNVEGWAELDRFGMMQQLGVIPAA
jgi:steroid delta-isomerase-like uncharacterized protein